MGIDRMSFGVISSTTLSATELLRLHTSTNTFKFIFISLLATFLLPDGCSDPKLRMAAHDKYLCNDFSHQEESLFSDQIPLAFHDHREKEHKERKDIKGDKVGNEIW